MATMTFSWRDRPVFVTGGGGYLGSWLVKGLLDHGARVVCLLRDSVPKNNLQLLGIADRVFVVHGDLCDADLIERTLNEYEIDTVFHLAAQSLVGTANRSPVGTFDTNIRGTWTVLEAARRISTVERTVVASSDKAYGSADSLPYRESFPMRGLHPYDASKSCTDIIARTYAHTYDMAVTVTRCANIYGGGDLNFNRIVPETIKHLVEGRSPVIRSDGTFQRDYLFVEDAVAAYLCLAERTADDDVRGRAFNFGAGEPRSVLEVVGALIDIHGRPCEPVILNQAKAEIHSQYLDCTRAGDILGWKPTHDLKTGLEKTYRWYADYLADRGPHEA